MVENPQEKNYNYFIDSMVQMRNLFEQLTPSDICMLCELPFPVYNDILLKQIEENKRQKSKIDGIKNQNKQTILHRKR